MRTSLLLAGLLTTLCGCVITEVGVTNPVSGLTTVAVVPFFNLSQERAVDGQRFAMAYFTELQKTPGFQVVPVGVVEQAMYDNRLAMNNPDDVLRLAQILNVDAVVVGAVTDYSPYYPPRIGMQVSWYSPRPWTFYPGVPVDEYAREMEHPNIFSRLKAKKVSGNECPPEAMIIEQTGPPTVIRGQSAEDAAAVEPGRTVSLPEFLLFGEDGAPQRVVPVKAFPEDDPPRELIPQPPSPRDETLKLPVMQSPEPEVISGQLTLSAQAFDPRQPFMSYTRIFDGSDAKLTARLRDYTELSGDLRAGGWESHLHRSEDFIRFASHVMIVEMLQLHGGEAKKRVVFKFRKYR